MVEALDGTTEQEVLSGQQEVLNWFCLVGAMAELGCKVDMLEWAETWILNAPKCMALFK